MTNTPCSVDPDQWFIGRDGRQYPDEILDEEGVRQGLIRRRQAKEACFNDCPSRVRLACLDLALVEPNPPLHGTWGGYHEDELRKIRDERDRRRMTV